MGFTFTESHIKEVKEERGKLILIHIVETACLAAPSRQYGRLLVCGPSLPVVSTSELLPAHRRDS